MPHIWSAPAATGDPQLDYQNETRSGYGQEVDPGCKGRLLYRTWVGVAQKRAARIARGDGLPLVPAVQREGVRSFREKVTGSR